MLMPTVFALGPMVWSMILIGLVNGRLSAELWRLATVDALTGVRTRRSFLEGARRVLDRGGRPVLLLLDLDRFKQINDRFGHASGDRVLARFAKLLRDTSPEGTLVGRYGGEEFCLLLPDASPEAGRLHAQRLCDAVRAVAFGLATETPVTVSIGVASTPDGATLEELLLAADRRLYRAKAEGRDRVVAEDAPSAPETVPWSSLQLDAADGPPSERERRLMS
jgi:diguanylate cyclase (GGDEF)-like protein